MPGIVRNIIFAGVAIIFITAFYQTAGGSRAPLTWRPKTPDFKGFAPLPEGIGTNLPAQQEAEKQRLRAEQALSGAVHVPAANPLHVLPGGEQVNGDGKGLNAEVVGLGSSSGTALGGTRAGDAAAGIGAASDVVPGSGPVPAIDQSSPIPPLNMPHAPAPGMVHVLPMPPSPGIGNPPPQPPMPATPGLGALAEMPPIQPNLGSTMGGTAPVAPPLTDPHFQGGFAEAPFQQQLDLQTPNMDILKLRRYKPHNYKGEGHPTYATHITTPGGSLNDPYFLAAQQLIYRVLWDMRSGTAQYPFTAFVAPHITEEQRSVLAAAGAIVRELDPVDWHPDKDTLGRWQYNFARLNLWRQTDFSKILYLDADAFPLQKLDELMDHQPLQCKKDLLPLEDQSSAEEICSYTFLVAPQNPLATPPSSGVIELNTGVLLIQPNLAMHRRLTRDVVSNKHWDTSMTDEAFFSEMFKSTGPFPFSALPREYNGFFPSALDEGRLKVVHEKLWVEMPGSAPWTKNLFREKHAEMRALYESKGFQDVRMSDGELVY